MADTECTKCAQIAKTEEELKAPLNADIAVLREKCFDAEQMLLKLRDQNSYLEGSLERSIQYIKHLKSEEAMEVNSSSRKGPSTVRFHEDVTFMSEVDDFCGIIESTTDLKMSDLKISPPPESCKNIGAELDALLVSIESTLGVGECGPQAQLKPRSKRAAQDDLSTKTW